jgi:uncharacterized oxidoreductase
LIITHNRLERLVSDFFGAAGGGQAERALIAYHIVEANLVGHDSHGVIRVPAFIDWLRAGKVLANQTLKVVFENVTMAEVDERFGFGQVIGEESMKLGIDKVGGGPNRPSLSRASSKRCPSGHRGPTRKVSAMQAHPRFD